MPSPIRILDETTINQIAAGEVIESLASVIKELVDNAVDAGSTEVKIETQSNFVRVIDNGLGMSPDDLELAIERHATSKLIAASDLQSINTLGFRGEALPSIASISKLRIHSASDDRNGSLLTVEGGKKIDLRPLPRKRGTTVEVNALFFNVPVRKGFQKERLSDVNDLLIRFALSFSNVGFEWHHEGRLQWSVKEKENFSCRVNRFFNEQLSVAMNSRVEQISVHGFLSSPFMHRPNRTGHYLFLNKRMVHVPLIAKAIREGYGMRLAEHRYPLFALHVGLPPHWIDINVHPQKKEVRLQQEELIGSFFIEAVEKTLQKQAKPIPISAPLNATGNFSDTQINYHIKQPNDVIVQTSFAEDVITILTFMGPFILAEYAHLTQDIMVVDAKAAQFRINFDEISKKIEIGKPSAQCLLFPVSFEVNMNEKVVLLENIELLKKFGLGIRNFGGNNFIVDSLPSYVENNEPGAVVRELLTEITQNKQDKAKQIACYLARRGSRMASSFDEAKALIKALLQCKEHTITPLGKPTYFLLTREEIAKRLRYNG